MRAWAKLITLLTITCYLAASSIAALHAFPAANISPAVSWIGDSVSQNQNGMNCHQSDTTLSDANSVSSCKMFCAATTNLIANEFSVDLLFIPQSTPIDLIGSEASTASLEFDPHPPK